MAFTFGALRRIVGFRPKRMLDRFPGVLDEGLAEEFRAEVSPPDPLTLATSLDDRRDA